MALQHAQGIAKRRRPRYACRAPAANDKPTRKDIGMSALRTSTKPTASPTGKIFALAGLLFLLLSTAAMLLGVGEIYDTLTKVGIVGQPATSAQIDEAAAPFGVALSHIALAIPIGIIGLGLALYGVIARRYRAKGLFWSFFIAFPLGTIMALIYRGTVKDDKA
jgi:hypothetical protein